MRPHVFLAMPRSGDIVRCWDAARSFWYPGTGQSDVTHWSRPNSSLPSSFNDAWCQCLNDRSTKGFTHFAMIHDDVCPDLPWLDVMLDELTRLNANVLSAVIPIKDERGLTTTALDSNNPTIRSNWYTKRFTLTECYSLVTDSFTSPDILLNTGLFVVKLDSWCAKTHFQQLHRIVQDPGGTLYEQRLTEDWDWSRQCRSLGVTLYATLKVPLYHERPEYHNRCPWGDDTDTDYESIIKEIDSGS